MAHSSGSLRGPAKLSPNSNCCFDSVEYAQFRSRRFVEALRHRGLCRSMGRVGACADNAAMESFFSLLQKDVLDRQRWLTKQDVGDGRKLSHCDGGGVQRSLQQFMVRSKVKPV